MNPSDKRRGDRFVLFSRHVLVDTVPRGYVGNAIAAAKYFRQLRPVQNRPFDIVDWSLVTCAQCDRRGAGRELRPCGLAEFTYGRTWLHLSSGHIGYL